MKIRQAFVANSSSSSFLISTPARQKKIRITLDVDVDNFEKIETFEQIEDLCKDYGYDKATEDKLKLELTFNRAVYRIHASNEDDEAWSQIFYQCEGNEASIIRDMGVTVIDVDYEE